MLDMNHSYTAIRGTAGLYPRGDAVWMITGPGRQSFVQTLLARSIEFAPVDTCVDSVLLNEQGHPVGVATAMLGEDEIALVVEALPEWFTMAEQMQLASDVTIDKTNYHALQIEGPLSWKAVAPLVTDRDISDVLLHECVVATIDGTPTRMARAGTSSEFGYLIITAAASVIETLQAFVMSIGGDLIDPTVMDRIRVEVNFPVLPAQLDGVTLFECGLPWMATLTRTDTFVGSGHLRMEPPTRRTVAALFADADCPPVGSPVLVDGESVGVVSVQAPRAGQPDGLGLLLLNDPFGVPGVCVSADGLEGRTVSRPVLDPRSWSLEIGIDS